MLQFHRYEKENSVLCRTKLLLRCFRSWCDLFILHIKWKIKEYLPFPDAAASLTWLWAREHLCIAVFLKLWLLFWVIWFGGFFYLFFFEVHPNLFPKKNKKKKKKPTNRKILIKLTGIILWCKLGFVFCLAGFVFVLLLLWTYVDMLVHECSTWLLFSRCLQVFWQHLFPLGFSLRQIHTKIIHHKIESLTSE